MRTSSIKAITKSKLIQKELDAKPQTHREDRSSKSNSNWITNSLLAVLILGFGFLAEKDLSQPTRPCVEKDQAICQINSLITQAESFSSEIFDSGPYSSTNPSKKVNNNQLIRNDSAQNHSQNFLSTKFLLQ
mgnify:CR=1 FL=1